MTTPTQMNSPMPLEELVAAVLDLEPSEVSLDSSRENTEKWDSLAQLSILSAVEDTYGVMLSTEQMMQVDSIRAIRALLKTKGISG